MKIHDHIVGGGIILILIESYFPVKLSCFLSFVTGWFSHYIFDAVPHSEDLEIERAEKERRTGKLFWVLLFEVICGGGALLFLAQRHDLALILCGVGATVPDCVKPVLFFFPQSRKIMEFFETPHEFSHNIWRLGVLFKNCDLSFFAKAANYSILIGYWLKKTLAL